MMEDFVRKMIKSIDRIVNLIALLLILVAMSFSGYMLWDSNQIYASADEKNYETYIPTEKHTESFKQLQKINSEVIGWIRVNNTHIDYPLVQTDNDDTYMNTDAFGKYNLAGAIFLHAANSPDFTDFNSLIYGHHMEKHKMFGDIGLFTRKKYFQSHRYGNLYFNGKNHGIEFYALLQVDALNEVLFNVCPNTHEAKIQYLKQIEDNVLYKRSITLTENDHLVLLSTCTSDMTNGRNILVGRLTDKVYPQKQPKKNLGNGVDALKKVPVWIWILFILLIIYIYISHRKKGKDEK